MFIACACYSVMVLNQEAAGQPSAAEKTEATGKPSLASTKEGGDQALIQGVWTVVSLEMGGMPVKNGKAVFMVRGNRVCWQTSDVELNGGLYLDPTSHPKAYDIASFSGPCAIRQVDWNLAELGRG